MLRPPLRKYSSIRALKHGHVNVVGIVTEVTIGRTDDGSMQQVEIALQDDTGKVRAVQSDWFTYQNQSSDDASFSDRNVGHEYSVTGMYEVRNDDIRIYGAELELVTSAPSPAKYPKTLSKVAETIRQHETREERRRSRDAKHNNWMTLQYLLIGAGLLAVISWLLNLMPSS